MDVSMPPKVFFDVEQLYYLPQYLPVYEELRRRGVDCKFIVYRQDQILPQLQALVAQQTWPLLLISREEAGKVYVAQRPDWVVFGNHNPHQNTLPHGTRSALLYHGIGVKECYYDPRLATMTVRFVEGAFRLRELQRRYPNATFVDVGFPKLDPLFGPCAEAVGKSGRRTVLYAPTFYPSSIELLPPEWPAALADCAVVIKPHFFSMAMPQYERQRRILERWAERFANVTLATVSDYSLVPYMAKADILISEASSALFEFAALDRPVVWLDFFKLRWTYRGPLRFRFERRMDRTILQYADIAAHAAKPADFVEVVRRELVEPDRLSGTRKRYTAELVGPVDGKASVRIADYLLGQQL